MKILISLLFLTFVLGAPAQNHSVGIKAGYNSTNIATSVTVLSNYEMQGNFSAGLSYDLTNKSKFTFGAEILFDNRGYSRHYYITDISGNLPDEPYAFIVKFDYLAIPVKFGYKSANRFFGFANIGICPALLLQAKASEPVFDAGTVIYKGDTAYTFNTPDKFDLAGLAEFGMGYNFNNRLSVSSSFRGQYSLTSFTNDDYEYFGFANHYGLALSIGFHYSLSGATDALIKDSAQ